MRCLKCKKSIKSRSFYGLHSNCYMNWFQVKPSQGFSDWNPKKSDSSSGHFSKNKNTFYHGRYRKYSAKINSVQYILKVQEKDFPDLPAMEYLCNQIASLLGLNVPEYYLIRIEDNFYSMQEKQNSQNKKTHGSPGRQDLFKNTKNLMVFVTKNFMQNQTGTLNHIYKFLPLSGNHYNCKKIIDVLYQETRKPIDISRFIKIVLFDSLIGNNDRHGRNLGIIDKGKNRHLAPMYDNPSYFGTEDERLLGADISPSGCIWTSSSKEPRLLDYIEEFKSLNYGSFCISFLKKILSQSQKIIKAVELSYVSEKRKKAFVYFLKKQLKIIKSFQEL